MNKCIGSYKIIKCLNSLISISVPLPCIVSEWTAWSAPDATGTRYRVRYTLRPALNGGKECPDLMQIGKGI